MKNKAVNALIKFEESVMVMIKLLKRFLPFDTLVPEIFVLLFPKTN